MEVKILKYMQGNSPLGLDDKYKFGIEIEAFNVNTAHNARNFVRNTSERFKGRFTGDTKEHRSLYHARESNKFFKETLSSKGKPYKRATVFEEALVGKGGAEIVSPILQDNSHDWDSIDKVCEHIKKYPGTRGKEVVANSKCGLHVHFDAGLLTERPEIMETFKTLWPEMEELVYKMCNNVGDPVRKSTINRSKSIFSSFRKMASPIGQKLLKQISEDKLKVSYKDFGFLKRHIVAPLKLDESRYQGLNLSNIGNPNKNTVEFRMSNGTLDPEVIKQNVFLYASIIETSRNIALGENYKTNELEQFLKTDLTEEEKAKAFTNLVFNNEEDRQIYINRWKSVKDADVFRDSEKKGFATNRFTRDGIKEVAGRPSYKLVNNVMNFITRSRENEMEGESIRE